MRPRRSLLYAPGANARAMAKARSLDVDGVILDVEDAVAPGAKDDARRQVAAVVSAGGFGAREVADAWERSTREGRGVVVVDGRIVEKLHVEEASRLLALDEAVRARRTSSPDISPGRFGVEVDG